MTMESYVTMDLAINNLKQKQDEIERKKLQDKQRLKMLPSPAGGDPSKKNKYVDVAKGGGDLMKKGGPGPSKRLIPVKEPNLSSESDSDKENRNPTLPTKRNKQQGATCLKHCI